MDSSHLTPEQVAVLIGTTKRYLDYLNKLCARMQRLRFPADDPLIRATLTARGEMQRLYDTNRGCRRGGGANS